MPKKAQTPVFNRTIAPQARLMAKEPPPQLKLKHQAYFEFVENTDRKKQLVRDRPAGLVAKEPPPQPKLKHQAYFEFIENTGRAKVFREFLAEFLAEYNGEGRNQGECCTQLAPQCGVFVPQLFELLLPHLLEIQIHVS